MWGGSRSRGDFEDEGVEREGDGCKERENDASKREPSKAMSASGKGRRERKDKDLTIERRIVACMVDKGLQDGRQLLPLTGKGGIPVVSVSSSSRRVGRRREVKVPHV